MKAKGAGMGSEIDEALSEAIFLHDRELSGEGVYVCSKVIIVIVPGLSIIMNSSYSVRWAQRDIHKMFGESVCVLLGGTRYEGVMPTTTSGKTHHEYI